MTDSTLSDPKPIGDFVMPEFLAELPPPKPFDTEAFMRSEVCNDGVRYFDRYCPPAYKTFDQNHPGLASNAKSVETTLAYKFNSRGLLLSGPTNKGKTRTCWQLLRRLYGEDAVECRWYHAMDFFTQLQECVKYGRDDAKGWISDLAWRKMVFIDDLGQEANLKSREDWAEGWFFRFLDLRIERALPLVITTNLTAKDMARKQNDIRSDPFLRRVLDVCDVVRYY